MEELVKELIEAIDNFEDALLSENKYMYENEIIRLKDDLKRYF